MPTPLRSILPALYLASSWTWVIGMYFPVYLLADFGWPGWVTFAIPNVIGAAAMGFVLRSPQSSDRFIAANPCACWWFSAITIAFHVSVLSWLLASITAQLPVRNPQGWWGPPIAAVLTLLAFVASFLRFRASLIFAAIVYIISLACAYLAWHTTRALPIPALILPPSHGTQSTLDLLCITPVLLFGFALCPYLDLTFHRIRREYANPTAPTAFALGFGIFFLAMIVFTLFYAGAMLKGVISYYIVAHIAAQSVFTMSVHFREMRLVSGSSSPRPKAQDPRLLVPLLIALSLATGILPFLAPHALERTAYEAFMSFYGITFPLIAWIHLTARNLPARTRIITWAVAVALGLPLLWFGWTQKNYVLVPFAITIAIAAPLVAKRVVSSSSGRG